VDVKDAYILGPVLVLDKVMEQYGIYSILQHIAQQHLKLSYNFQKAVFSLILSRFVQPVSKLSLYDHWMDKFYPDKVDTNLALHHIYRSLDILDDEKESIENNLYHYSKDLFTLSVDVVLYDLTTLRFESTRTDLDTLQRFGYSKKKRSDCTQVVLGLLTDQEGIPLCFEVHPGNTFEGHTLKGIVNKMREKFQVRRFIFVADRGLFSEENIEELKKEGGEFIVGWRLGKKIQNIKDAYDIKQYKWVSESLVIYETTLKDERVILFWSAARAERDRKTYKGDKNVVAQSQSWEGVYDPEFFDKEEIDNRLRRLVMHLKIA
jgi:transposase